MGINEVEEMVFVYDSLEFFINGGMVGCLARIGDLGFGGGY